MCGLQYDQVVQSLLDPCLTFLSLLCWSSSTYCCVLVILVFDPIIRQYCPRQWTAAIHVRQALCRVVGWLINSTIIISESSRSAQLSCVSDVFNCKYFFNVIDTHQFICLLFSYYAIGMWSTARLFHRSVGQVRNTRLVAHVPGLAVVVCVCPCVRVCVRVCARGCCSKHCMLCCSKHCMLCCSKHWMLCCRKHCMLCCSKRCMLCCSKHCMLCCSKHCMLCCSKHCMLCCSKHCMLCCSKRCMLCCSKHCMLCCSKRCMLCRSKHCMLCCSKHCMLCCSKHCMLCCSKHCMLCCSKHCMLCCCSVAVVFVACKTWTL